MAEGRAAFEWDQLSALLALIANVNRSSKQKPVTPDAFNPFARRRMATPKDEVIPCEIGILKTIFIDRHKRRTT